VPSAPISGAALGTIASYPQPAAPPPAQAVQAGAAPPAGAPPGAVKAEGGLLAAAPPAPRGAAGAPVPGGPAPLRLPAAAAAAVAVAAAAGAAPGPNAARPAAGGMGGAAEPHAQAAEAPAEQLRRSQTAALAVPAAVEAAMQEHLRFLYQCGAPPAARPSMLQAPGARGGAQAGRAAAQARGRCATWCAR